MSNNVGGRQLLGLLVGVAVGCLIVLVLIVLLQTRQLTGAIREAQKPNVATLSLIEDCTSPDGECFRRGQDDTAAAVADVNRITILASACASRPGAQSAAQVESCVLRLLATRTDGEDPR